MYTDICSLATVCKQETRICIAQPTELDSVTAESTNISEEGFDSSEGKKDTTEAPPAMVLVTYEIFESVVRIESL